MKSRCHIHSPTFGKVHWPAIYNSEPLLDLEPHQVFCLSVPSPTNVDYTNAISMKFSNGATGSFSGSAFVPKDFGGTFYITVHGTLGVLYLDMEVKRERLFVRLNNGDNINYEIVYMDY